MTAIYIHGNSEEEQKRLSQMNDVLLNDAELREIALEGHERILELGSGLGQMARAMARRVPRGCVVGIERDSGQRAKAERLAAEDGEAQLVEWREGDVLRLELPDGEWGTFDVAHARFLLEHVPAPLEVVKAMVRAVRPGGRVILADDDHGVMRLWPESAGFSDLWRAYMRTYDRLGNDPIVGRRLVSLLVEAGAVPVRNTWIFFGGCSGMPQFAVLTANMIGVVITARESILRQGLFDEASFDAALRAYEEWRRRPDAAIWFAMSWAEGRV